MCSYFDQYPKHKGNNLILMDNYQFYFLPKLFTCLCLCAKIRRVVVVAKFQSARGMYYFFVSLASKIYARRRLFLNIWLERGINSLC